MCFHILDDHVVQSLVTSTAGVDADPENQPLKVLKKEDADESKAYDNQYKHHIEKHEEYSEILVEDAVWNQIIATETNDDQNQGNY